MHFIIVGFPINTTGTTKNKQMWPHKCAIELCTLDERTTGDAEYFMNMIKIVKVRILTE